MSSESNKGYTRRDILKISFGGAVVTASTLAAPVSHALSSEPLIDRTDEHSIKYRLAQTLRKIGNKKCLDKASQLLESRHNNDDLYFHLRSFNLDNNGAQLIANTLRALKEDQLSRLVSFSLSYNPLVGDVSIVELSKALPSSIQEIGFVGCGLGDRGALALCEFAKRSPGLQMMCIENNAISAGVKRKILSETKLISRLALYI
jgi:hypothetical protein